MGFGLPAEIAVRCEHCGETGRRTPVELKSGRLVCFMCNRVSVLPPEAAVRLPTHEQTGTSAIFEMARRLATLQPPPPADDGPVSGPPSLTPSDGPETVANPGDPETLRR